MRVRLPLYAKISLWFLLNVLAVGAVFVVLFNAQFDLKLDWLLATGAGERLEAVRNLIVGELNATTPDEWTQVLSRYGEAHGVHFALYDDDANPLVGGVPDLPAEVRERISVRPGFPGASFGPRHAVDLVAHPALAARAAAGDHAHRASDPVLAAGQRPAG